MFNKEVINKFGSKAKSYQQYAVVQQQITDDLTKMVQAIDIDRNGLWLDIGSGPLGLNRNFYKDTQNNSIFSDISFDSLSYLNTDGYKICFDMDAIPIKENTISGISATSSLQWSSNFKLLLNNFYMLLEPKGHLVVSLFTEGSLDSLYKCQNEFNITEKPLFFNRKTIISTLKNAGFKIVEEKEKSYTEEFINAVDAIKSINKIGATTHGSKKLKTSELKNFIKRFEELSYNNDKYENRYNVLFIIAKK